MKPKRELSPEEIELEIQKLRLRRERSSNLFRAGCGMIVLGLMLPLIAIIVIALIAVAHG